MKTLLTILLFTSLLQAQDIIITRGSGLLPRENVTYYLISSEGDTLLSSEGDTLITIQNELAYENNNIIDAVYNDCFISDLQCRSNERQRIYGIRKRTILS